MRPLRFRFGRSRRERTSWTSHHRRALRLAAPPVKESRSSRCSANVFHRVDLAARARELAVVSFARTSLRCGSGFAPNTSWTLRSRTSSRSFVDLLVNRVFPTRSFRRALRPTSLGWRSRRARLPPLSGRPARWQGLPGTRGCGPAATPVLPTDVCSSRMLFSKTIALRLGTRRTVRSHAMREPSVHAEPAHFGELADRTRALSAPATDPPAYL